MLATQSRLQALLRCHGRSG